MVKVAGTEFIWYAANRAFQLAGGEAYITDAPYEKILRDIRVFPIFEGANDVMRLFIALEGITALGAELDDLRNLDLSSPLETFGAIAGYLGGRMQRRVAPARIAEPHPAVADRAAAVSDQVVELRNVTETLARRHGEGVVEHQAQLKRLAHAAIELYAQLATIARASDALDPATTADELGDEGAIADMFCRRAAARAARWHHQIDGNDDPAAAEVAAALLERGRFAHAP
jgi:acyl-CoA dehydrogenase family protein 9